MPKLNLETLKLDSASNTKVSACVHLDGHCLFKLSDRKSNLAHRIRYTEERLSDVKDIYLQSNQTQLNVSSRGDRNQQSLDVAVGAKKIPVLTLDRQDLVVQGANLKSQAETIATQIKRGLEKARQERQSSFLLKQTQLAGVVLLLMVSEANSTSRSCLAINGVKQLCFILLAQTLK